MKEKPEMFGSVTLRTISLTALAMMWVSAAIEMFKGREFAYHLFHYSQVLFLTTVVLRLVEMVFFAMMARRNG